MKLVSTDLDAPNGIALSPDERTLYVSDVDPSRPAWLADDLKPDATVANGRESIDASRWCKDPFFGPDGFKVGEMGNIFGARPGGLNVNRAERGAPRERRNRPTRIERGLG